VGDLGPGEPYEKGERRIDREPDDHGELPARGHDVVLCRPRPADKSLGDALARWSLAQELGECGGDQPSRLGVNGRKANALCKADAPGQAAASWARLLLAEQSPARRPQTNKPAHRIALGRGTLTSIPRACRTGPEVRGASPSQSSPEPFSDPRWR
jgi:hypothetical protein